MMTVESRAPGERSGVSRPVRERWPKMYDEKGNADLTNVGILSARQLAFGYPCMILTYINHH